jgi:hypothetical protein
MNWISRLPLRKPLVVLATAVFLAMFIFAWAIGKDIPPNMSGVCSTFIGVVMAGYFASSTYESRARPPEKDKSDEDA